MVHLTADYIVRYNGHTKKQRDEPTNHYLKRITHLYMAERGIETIDNLSACRNLTVLYLYDNKLDHTINLGTAQNLTHLYLQNNNISKIEGLGHLTRLVKLYIGYNSISVVEGLQNLQQLTELHVENQRIAVGEKVLFDPRCIAALGRCLNVINVSGNKLDSLSDLCDLHELTTVFASDNELVEFADVKDAINSWRKLNKVELSGNPICHKPKYRDKVILMSQTLETLDGRVIKPMERKFLLSWQASRELRKRHDLFTRQHFGNIENLADLPPLQQPIHPAAPPPHYTMGGLPGGRKRFEAILAKSRSLPASAAQPPEGRRPQQYSSPAIRPLPERHDDATTQNARVSKKLNRQMTPHPNNTRWMRSRTVNATRNPDVSNDNQHLETAKSHFQFRSSGRHPPMLNGGIHPISGGMVTNGHNTLDGQRTTNSQSFMNGQRSHTVPIEIGNKILNKDQSVVKPLIERSSIGDNLTERGTLVPLPSPRMDGEGHKTK